MKTNSSIVLSLVVFFYALVPVVHAQIDPTTGVNSLVIDLIGVANNFVILLIIVSVIVFIWGVLRVVFSVDDKKRTEGRKYLIYGVIAFAVMSGLWGLSNFLLEFFSIEKDANFVPPKIEIPE